jgi:uncharacterized membrane protein YdbT with pleckstrin-like domain
LVISQKGAKKMETETIIVKPSLFNFIFEIGITAISMMLFLFVRSHGVSGFFPLLFGAFFVVSLLYSVINVILEYFGNTYTITSENVIQRRGIIARNVSEIRLIDIRDIGLEQGVLQRIFECGDLLLSSAGQAGIEVVFKGIHDPISIQQIINDRRKQAMEAIEPEIKRCPQCAEDVKFEAKVCRFCGHKFVDDE